MSNPFSIGTVEYKVFDRLKTMRVGSSLSDNALRDVIEEMMIVHLEAMDDHGDDVEEETRQSTEDYMQAIYDEKLKAVKDALDAMTEGLTTASKTVAELLDDPPTGPPPTPTTPK